MPSGCTAKLLDGVVEGIYNTFGGAQSIPCEGTEEKKVKGLLDTASVSSDMQVEILPGSRSVVLKITGPNEGWFGFGFDAYKMSETPYTIIIEPQSKHIVSEWRLGPHSRGILLDQDDLSTWKLGNQAWVENGCKPALNPNPMRPDC